jgi:hypothetical protein
MLLRIFYTSTARKPFSQADLEALLLQSRTDNVRWDVTGALLYHDHSFFQVIEGPPDNVRDLWAKIENDPRHYALHLFLEQQTETRLFAEWQMAWVTPQAVEAAGFNPRLLRQESYADAELQAMLDTFRRAVRLI